MIQLRRAPGESVERFLRRFSQKLRQTMLLQEVKNRKFYTPKPSRRQIKKSALHKQKAKKRIDYLKKAGKLKNDERARF